MTSHLSVKGGMHLNSGHLTFDSCGDQASGVDLCSSQVKGPFLRPLATSTDRGSLLVLFLINLACSSLSWSLCIAINVQLGGNSCSFVCKPPAASVEAVLKLLDPP